MLRADKKTLSRPAFTIAYESQQIPSQLWRTTARRSRASSCFQRQPRIMLGARYEPENVTAHSLRGCSALRDPCFCKCKQKMFAEAGVIPRSLSGFLFGLARRKVRGKEPESEQASPSWKFDRPSFEGTPDTSVCAALNCTTIPLRIAQNCQGRVERSCANVSENRTHCELSSLSQKFKLVTKQHSQRVSPI
jgi:hypothetical protein